MATESSRLTRSQDRSSAISGASASARGASISRSFSHSAARAGTCSSAVWTRVSSAARVHSSNVNFSWPVRMRRDTSGSRVVCLRTDHVSGKARRIGVPCRRCNEGRGVAVLHEPARRIGELGQVLERMETLPLRLRITAVHRPAPIEFRGAPRHRTVVDVENVSVPVRVGDVHVRDGHAAKGLLEFREGARPGHVVPLVHPPALLHLGQLDGDRLAPVLRKDGTMVRLAEHEALGLRALDAGSPRSTAWRSDILFRSGRPAGLTDRRRSRGRGLPCPGSRRCAPSRAPRCGPCRGTAARSGRLRRNSTLRRCGGGLRSTAPPRRSRRAG